MLSRAQDMCCLHHIMTYAFFTFSDTMLATTSSQAQTWPDMLSLVSLPPEPERGGGSRMMLYIILLLANSK